MQRLPHSLEEVALGPRVERRGRLVEDHERRVAEARERHALPLPDREVEAAGELAAEHRLVPFGERREELMRVRACGRLEDRVDVVDSLLPPQADVLTRGKQVALEVLDDRDGTAKVIGVHIREVEVVPADTAGLGRYSPASIFASVVLPEPFSPTSAMISPLLILGETPSTAGRSDSG